MPDLFSLEYLAYALPLCLTAIPYLVALFDDWRRRGR